MNENYFFFIDYNATNTITFQHGALMCGSSAAMSTSAGTTLLIVTKSGLIPTMEDHEATRSFQ